MKKIEIELEEKTVNLIKKCLKILKQPSLVDVGEWANKYRNLDSTSSKEVGRFSVERTPYMVEIYKEISKGDTKQFSLMMASQLAKSELIINIAGRYAHLDPCPMLLVQPTDEMARSFSKERLQPAINNSEVLKEIIKAPNKKDSGNTVTHKMFPGGYIAFVGANSPSKLAARPIRIIFLDEVDRYPKSSGDEGSPISLAKKRTTTFDDITKHIITGTPTIKGASEIEDEYKNSSQAEWYIPCPKCESHQTLKWGNVKWEEGGKNVKMVCEKCGELSTEKEWKSHNLKTGKWIHKFPEKRQNLGYRLSALASPFRKWDSIVAEWLEIKGDVEKLKAFLNTVLAETFEEEYKGKLDAKKLIKRTREKYDYIPEKVLILTAGVDIQDGWIAIEVVGWGLGFESWGMEYIELKGNMEQQDIWNKLDEVLFKEYSYKNGDKLKIFASCIDTGGHHTQKVYDYVSKRPGQMIIGIKGQGGENVPINNG
ncbi:MAG: terminase, partial [Fusobacteriales bacterium]